METDIPLKALTAACAPDLLPLLGLPDAEVLAVESLELPVGATALDNVLRLRDRAGGVFLHLLEWQGYRDLLFLWRVMSYLAWLGLHRPERPIAVTVVYLKPGDDVGETLQQSVAGQANWSITFTSVRLWEHDAAAAVASGRVGLAVLSPLMGGATSQVVEQAAGVVLAEAGPPRRQADLLTILGVFAAPLVTPERFVRLVGKERLMTSDLISYLFEDKIAEWEQERARLEQERQVERARLEQALMQTVEEIALARFPATPASLLAAVRTVHDPTRLQQLHHAVLYAPDQPGVEQLLRDLTSSSSL